jgi:hypothetical protein
MEFHNECSELFRPGGRLDVAAGDSFGPDAFHQGHSPRQQALGESAASAAM